MKITQTLKAVYINSKKEDYETKDGRKGSTYYVSIDQNGECGTLRTNEDVFSILQNMSKYKEVEFVTEFNDQSKYFPYNIIMVKPKN